MGSVSPAALGCPHPQRDPAPDSSGTALQEPPIAGPSDQLLCSFQHSGFPAVPLPGGGVGFCQAGPCTGRSPRPPLPPPPLPVSTAQLAWLSTSHLLAVSHESLPPPPPPVHPTHRAAGLITGRHPAAPRLLHRPSPSRRRRPALPSETSPGAASPEGSSGHFRGRPEHHSDQLLPASSQVKVNKDYLTKFC